MDGKTVQRIRLLERENAELKLQNTHLSAEVLRMAARIDDTTRSAHLDRLLTAALIVALGDEDGAHYRTELPIGDVEALKVAMATPPGLHINTQKDEARGAWVIEVRPNPGDVPVIHQCAACGQDHINPQQRPVTPAEADRGILFVATCPTTGKEVFAGREAPSDESRIIELAR